MTVYEKIKEMTFDEMTTFLLIFARETIDMFGNFQFPREDTIREFLNRKKEGE